MKILVIGWDGATWEYIDPLLAEGKLPHLEKLLARGTRATLHSTVPPYTNVAWPSLVTGLRPEKTGVFDGARTRPGTYEAIPTNLTGHKGIPIWKWANQKGLRAGVLNVPMTFPADEIDGYLVSGFDSPAGSLRVAHPPGLLQRWMTRGLRYDLLDEEISLMEKQNPHRRRGDLHEFVRRWVALTRRQGELAAWLWEHDPVDLFFMVFSGTDSVNHRTRDQGQIARVYVAADAALGQIIEACADEETLVCLLSDHGSCPADRYISLYRALFAQGWLHFHPWIASRFVERLPGLPGRWASAVWSSISPTLKKLISQLFLRWDSRLAVSKDNIDWRRTAVFARTGMGALYLNVEGRHPLGTVTGEAYKETQQDVREVLSSLTDQNERPLFAWVRNGQDQYPDADPADDPPDLVFRPASWSDHVITGFPSDPLTREIPEDGEYGTHTSDGILLLAGPGVRHGLRLDPAEMVDVVPTLLALSSLPIPDYVQGRVLDEVATQAPDPVFEEVPSGIENEGSYSAAEANEVMERLRGLGYL